MSQNNIEILIPTFNEEKNIETVIKELNTEGYYNITILDANSTDNTVAVAKKNNCKIISDTKDIKGFGGSIINGLNNLELDYFCIFDGDNSFNPNVFEDISLYLKRKIEIMKIYSGELLQHPFPRSEVSIKSLAHLWGSTINK